MQNKNNGNGEYEIFIYKTSLQPTNVTMTTIANLCVRCKGPDVKPKNFTLRLDRSGS